MSLVAAVGGAVSVAYLSDGSRSHPRSRRFPPARVAALRTAEACAALALLGVRERPSFFGLEDGTLDALDAHDRAATVRRLAEAIDASQCEIVLAPWPRDPHPDHRAASSIARSAVASLRRQPRFAGYEVWLPIRGEAADRPQPGEATPHVIAFDGATAARKRSAILAHVTQTTRLIDDDPGGFRIDEALLQRWCGAVEHLHEFAIPLDPATIG